ncbi:MAG: J domain-containing protein [Thermodesulfobacteriota bacterium]
MSQTSHLNLAAQVLGVEVHASSSEIKYAYYRLMCAHHPDKNQGDPLAGQRTALINEARNMLLGRTLTPTLLKDKQLLADILQHPVSDAEDVLSYNDWLKAQFFNAQEGSIWP